MTTVTAKIPSTLAAKLAAEARAKRVAKSAILREVLEQRYKRRADKHRPTMWDRVGHLAGAIRNAPPDLASNPQYLDDLGA